MQLTATVHITSLILLHDICVPVRYAQLADRPHTIQQLSLLSTADVSVGPLVG